MENEEAHEFRTKSPKAYTGPQKKKKNHIWYASVPKKVDTKEK